MKEIGEKAEVCRTYRSTVAHNCHIETKCSQQIQIPRNMFRTLTSNYKSLAANSNHKSHTANYKLLTLPGVPSHLQLAMKYLSYTMSRYPRKLASLSSFVFELNEREPCFVFTATVMIYCNLFIAVSVLRMKKAIAIIVFKKFFP